MILSFKVKGDVISDHFLMLWFQKESLDTFGFLASGGGSRVQNQKVTFGVLKVPRGRGVGGSPVQDYVLNFTVFLLLPFNLSCNKSETIC